MIKSDARFIDWSEHGGCSRKIDGLRLDALIENLDLARPWADAAEVDALQGALAATVDIVLPMIDDPALFGEIVVVHVLSDLYAVGAKPIAGLNVLGVPEGIPVADESLQEMLGGAARRLRQAGATLLGGHSIENEQLFFGLTALGESAQAPMGHTGAHIGDRLVLTKPLGTSVATLHWKINNAAVDEFGDVVAGMRESNAAASEMLRAAHVQACTDVTGYGLAGHLHNLLVGSGVAAQVNLADLPRYRSTTDRVPTDGDGTRLLHANEDYVTGFCELPTAIDPAMRLYLFDAQVSGGLVAAVPEADLGTLRRAADGAGQPIWDIGVISDGRAGEISAVE
jgi:selenide,water dikinase